MEFKNTENIISQFCSKLIEKARANLNKEGKRATGTLFNQMSFDIEKTDDNIKGVISFGSAEDYWIFVDQGVKGAGGFKGSGRMRGGNSDFAFKKGGKIPPLNAIIQWTKVKGIKGRDKKGRFITDKSLGFLISRSIHQRGLQRTRFISKPYEEMQRDLAEDIQQAVTEDINAVDNETKVELKIGKK
tara:strand:+ start:37 stop:597 length:561 start_codon:yes stop_codon:yes gene_type:complete